MCGPAIVLVEGEAGIGKTRLLAKALEDARGRGMHVAAGRAEELERTRPFGVLAGALGCARSSPDPRRAAIAGLLAAPAAGDQGPITVTSYPGLRFRVVDAFTDLVEELALAGPVMLGLDDLQWADPSSLLTVGALARRLTGLPVGVIGCLRPSPRAAELNRLASALDAAGARHLTLHPLTREAVTGLVAQAVAAEPGPRLLAEVAGAAGNPLFITELLGALAQEEAITTVGGRAEVAETVLPPTLRLTILRRLSFLSEPTLQALRSASILGSGFSPTDLATVTGRPAVDLSVVLGEAMRARVLEDGGDRLRFRHELIRDAIYGDLAGSVRRALHREAGQRLAQAGAPALQVAEQFRRGQHYLGPGGAVQRHRVRPRDHPHHRRERLGPRRRRRPGDLTETGIRRASAPPAAASGHRLAHQRLRAAVTESAMHPLTSAPKARPHTEATIVSTEEDLHDVVPVQGDPAPADVCRRHDRDRTRDHQQTRRLLDGPAGQRRRSGVRPGRRPIGPVRHGSGRSLA